MIERTGAKALGLFAFLASLAALLGYGGAFAYAMLTSFDVVNLHRDAFIDDAFYYFEIARNLAAGKFSTFDGGITMTNGYHPVWLLLVTPFYWVLDLESALFGIKALEIMLIAGGVCLLAVAVRQAQLPWILLFAVLPALYCQPGMVVGTEAAVGAFFLGATLLAAVLFVRDARRWRWLLAAIAFLLPWVRLEYAAIALLVTAALALLPLGAALFARDAARWRGPLVGVALLLLLLPWVRHDFAAIALVATIVVYLLLAPGPRWLGRARLAWRRLRSNGLPLLAAVAGVLAYFLYNGIVFGGMIPISGAIKLDWGDYERELAGLLSLGDWLPFAVERFLDAGRADLFLLVELCCYVAAAFIAAAIRRWRDEDRLVLAVLVVMLALAAEAVAVRWQVAFSYNAAVGGYTFWYYAPGYLLAAMMVPVRCFVAILLWRALIRRRSRLVRQLGVSAVCAAGVYLAFDRHSFLEPFRFVQANVASSTIHTELPQEIAVAERLLPADATLGSWDAGAIGYFMERPVVNLDGLANSYDFMRGKWAVQMTHRINRLGDPRRREHQYVGPQALSSSLMLWRDGAYGGRSRSWLSITSPSVAADGTQNGMRVLRLGRGAVMFVPDCRTEATSNVPEMLTFSWAEGERRRSETRLWPGPVRTVLGYCAARFLLPHSVLGADLAVDGTTVDRLLAGSTPIVRSTYRVYSVGRQLIYVREACVGDADYTFLYAKPSRRRDLPYRYRQVEHQNLNDLLNVGRRVSGGRCLAAAELPAYEIDEVLTGQISPDHNDRVWQARIDGLALRADDVQGALADAERIVLGDLNVFLDRDKGKLLFVQAPNGAGPPVCRGAGVFVHFHPRRVPDLPTWRQQFGYDDASFDFESVGFDAGGRCVAAVPLPDFALGHLQTGLSGSDGHRWYPPAARFLDELL